MCPEYLSTSIFSPLHNRCALTGTRSIRQVRNLQAGQVDIPSSRWLELKDAAIEGKPGNTIMGKMSLLSRRVLYLKWGFNVFIICLWTFPYSSSDWHGQSFGQWRRHTNRRYVHRDLCTYINMRELHACKWRQSERQFFCFAHIRVVDQARMSTPKNITFAPLGVQSLFSHHFKWFLTGPLKVIGS